MALTVVKPSGIDSTGNYTVNGMTVSANANVSNLSANGTVNFASASNVTLGAIGNIKITGGTANYVLQTDGAGNLSWAEQTGGGGSSSSISNGNSNVSIPTANGNVNISSAGNANVVVVTGEGISLTGDIIPTVTNTYSLGSATYNFKDVFIGPGSLYVNGQKVLEQDSNTIVVTASINQNLRLETTGTGAIEFLPANTSVVAVKGTLQIDAGKSVTSSDGDKIRFSDTIAVDSITTASANTELVITGNGSGNVKIDDDLIVTGNLTLQGTTGNLSVGNLIVQDNIIDISAETTGTPTANAGIRVVRGDEAATQLRWTESITAWQFTNDGTNYLSLVGRDSTGNTSLGNTAIANYFVGNFYGTANTATTAGTVTTNAQPNITSVGLLSALSVGPNSSITLTGSSGFVKANSIQGTDGVNALYPGYEGVTGAVGITSNLTVGVGVAGNITANGTINFTSASNVSLGSLGNVKITGGTANYVISTDGAGNLSWVAQSGGGGGSSIANGTSNVNIATANGNITMSVNGNANIVTVTSTGVNVAGVTNLGSVSNVKITGGTANYVLSTDGTGNLSWVEQSGGGSANSVVVDTFTGNGVQTTFELSTTPSNINLTTINYNGATLLRDVYTLSGANITFDEAPANGYQLEITTLLISNNSGGGAVGGGVFYENNTNVSANYTITSGKNAMTAGPVTINTGVTVTVPSGSRWVIV